MDGERVVWLNRDCSVGKTCPQVGRRRDTGTLLIQGWIADDAGPQTASLRPRTVELPQWLLPGLAESGHPSCRPGRRNGEDTVVVTGVPLTEPDVLTEVMPPAGEAILEFAPSDLAGTSIRAASSSIRSEVS